MKINYNFVIKDNIMKYTFCNARTGEILEVKEYGKMLTLEGLIILDHKMYLIKDISIDILNQKTHIYVITNNQ
jgi:hypothetical protein